MPRSFKVYRTPIGFHDAYVAATTQKAALEAWGSDANLFARGLVETVTDPKLTAEPLANPGKVIKRSRGTAEEHFGTLKSVPASSASKRPTNEAPLSAKPRASKPKPRPSRAKLEAAEAAVTKAEEAHRLADRSLQNREEALRALRRNLENKSSAELRKLKTRVENAKSAYKKAIAEWSGA